MLVRTTRTDGPMQFAGRDIKHAIAQRVTLTGKVAQRAGLRVELNFPAASAMNPGDHSIFPEATVLLTELFTRLAEDRCNLVVAGRFSRGRSTPMKASLAVAAGLPRGPLLPLRGRPIGKPGRILFRRPSGYNRMAIAPSSWRKEPSPHESGAHRSMDRSAGIKRSPTRKTSRYRMGPAFRASAGV